MAYDPNNWNQGGNRLKFIEHPSEPGRIDIYLGLAAYPGEQVHLGYLEPPKNIGSGRLVLVPVNPYVYGSLIALDGNGRIEVVAG